ncbi:uncharacterized protein LOC117315712 isoform X2 [Pecten maximus]|nr:uncharacterized protein LOC117315712 isoform X2 [Pecten maximus]
MTQFVGALLLAVLTGTVSVVSGFINCYTCSYTITAAPWITFECANDTDHVTTGSPKVQCDDSLHCVTKVVYNADLTQIKSVTRGCFVPDPFKCGVNCCDQSIYDVSCQYQCRSDSCNNRDVTAKLKRQTGTASSTSPTVTMTCALMFCYFILYIFVGIK